MSEPSVTAVCLTNNRPEMLARAVASFKSQTYVNKKLLIFNTGEKVKPIEDDRISICNDFSREQRVTIGSLRNRANSATGGEILVHWDDDDWSHPNRIAEQVDLLQSTQADCVGYRDLLLWRGGNPEAWIYTSGDKRYAVGTSLCYLRASWWARPFDKTFPVNRHSTGEDSAFIKDRTTVGVSSFGADIRIQPQIVGDYDQVEPRIIAHVHGGNFGDYTRMDRDPVRWKRAALWDDYAKKIMEGK